MNTPWLSKTALKFSVGAAIVIAALAVPSAGLLRASHVDSATPAVAADSTGDYGGWKLVLNRPYPGKYEDQAWADTTNGWLVASNGAILHTADGGVTWEEQAKGVVYSGLRSIDFYDKMHGFAGTLTGKLFATSDGGVTWTDIAPTLPHIAKGFCGITHVGNQVHVVGRYSGAAADYFYSPDGGKTWEYTDMRDLMQGLVDVSFLDKKVGFIGGMGKSAAEGTSSALILKTTDGGKHWKPVFEHKGGRGFAWKIYPITKKLLYAGLQSQDGIYRIAKTTDGGDHWDTLTVATGKPEGPGIQGIGFLDANTGWVGGFFTGMWATTDGGKTWKEIPVPARLINRFEKVGNSMFTAGTTGIMRYNVADTKKK